MSTQSRKACRAGHTCQPQTFAEALDCLAHHSDVPLTQIAERVGRDVNYLRKATSQYDEAHPFRGDLIVPVTRAANNFVLLDYLESQVGRIAIALPGAEPGRQDLLAHQLAVVREVGEDAAAIERALHDGRVDAIELPRLKREIEESVKALLTLKAALQLKAGRPVSVTL